MKKKEVIQLFYSNFSCLFTYFSFFIGGEVFARPRQIARGLVSSDQIWFSALGVIACSISTHGGAGYVSRLCEAHDCGRFRYHLARENYLPLPIATFLFASDIPQKELNPEDLRFNVKYFRIRIDIARVASLIKSRTSIVWHSQPVGLERAPKAKFHG